MNAKHIRAVALCLFRHNDKILVEEMTDSVKQDRFCRSVGGGIEYGEPSAAALVREIREELSAEIEDVRLVGVLENLFIGEGAQGHEIVFVYDAVFVDKSLYERPVLQGYEHSGGADSHFTVRWLSLAEIKEAELRLVPDGIAALVR